MAVTIRNKQTEAMLRQLGLKWRAGPSGVVRRLAEQELARAGTVTPEEFKRRMKIWDELEREFPPPTEEEKRQMQYEMDHMYDYLDREPAPRKAKKRAGS